MSGDSSAPGRPERSRGAAASDDAAATEWRHARIVAVDDDTDQLLLLRHLLRRAGYDNVTTIRQPRQLLEHFGDLRPDIVLLDLQMPDLDGFAVLEQLSATVPSGDHVPVVVLTSDQHERSRQRALRLGAHDFVAKPLDRTEVWLRIRNLLRTRQQHLQLRRRGEALAEEVEERGADLALFHAVLEAIDDAVVIEDPSTGEVIYRNAAMADVRAATDLDRNTWNEGGLAGLSGIPQGGARTARAFEGILCHADGTTTPVDVAVQMVRHRERDLVVGIARDISERKEAERALSIAADREHEAANEARRLNELKNSLLAAVNHELRTPLTLIRGISATLEDDRVTPAHVEQLAPALSRHTKKLENLLDDLLDLDRLERGGLLFEPRRANLAELVASVIDEARLAPRELSLDLPRVEALVDRAKFQRIVSNLLRNAARHTPPDTEVRVILRDGQRIRLTVVDDGPGVPEHLKDEIFEPFAQGESRPAHQPGTGVGLSLVRIFAEVHGGRAWVEDAPGGGAAFHVELPREPTRPFVANDDAGLAVQRST